MYVGGGVRKDDKKKNIDKTRERGRRDLEIEGIVEKRQRDRSCRRKRKIGDKSEMEESCLHRS